MKNKETKKQSRWKVWKSGGPTINKVHIIWEGQKFWRNLPHVETKRDNFQICVAFSEKLSFTYKVFWMKRFCFYFCINMCIAFFVALFCAIFELWICPLDFFQRNSGNPISNWFSGPFCPLVPLALKSNLRWDCRCSFGWNQADRFIVQKWHKIKQWKR